MTPEPELDPTDEVRWSREWEWPRVSLPAVRGWRPGARTTAVILLLVFLPFLASSLVTLPLYWDAFQGHLGGGDLTVARPFWLRVYYGTNVGFAAVQAVLVIGAGLLLWRRRLGGFVVLAALLCDFVGHVLILIAYAVEGPVPRADMTQAIADVPSRLLLLGLAVLLVLPRRAAESPAEQAFAPPAP